MKALLLCLLLVTFGCTKQPVLPAALPDDEFLIIAHRGASAYAPGHTIAAYEMALAMGANYIELDLHMTKDGKLVALHDRVITIKDAEETIADITFDELQLYSPGELFNEQYPDYASPDYNHLRIVDLEKILLHFGDTANYYIEIKSPAAYPGIEEELIRQLQNHFLLNRDDALPKVIIQSFDSKSLKKINKLEPSIPLIKLYTFIEKASLSDKELKKLVQYASGIGVNADVVTQDFIELMHNNGLHVHPYTVNDYAAIYSMIMLGANGIFTDKPDTAVHAKNNENSMKAN